MSENWTPPRTKKTLNPLTLVLALSGAFFVAFLVISGVLFLVRSPSDSSPSRGAGSALFRGKGSVAVVEVLGTIMDSKKTIRRLERVEEDPDIKAVVLRVDSPGGAVAPSQEIYEAVRNLKKPVVASMGSVAASGGLYISMGAKKVFANPGTITGSIGVIMQFANLEKLYEWAKIRRFVIKTGRFKDVGAEYRAMTEDERRLIQGMIDEVLGQFKKAVATGRKLPLEQVTQIADGRILSGSQAKAAKLVDELGTLQDAVNEAGKMAGIQGKPHVVYPDQRSRKWMELFLDDNRDDSYDSSAGRFSGTSASGSGGILERLISAAWRTLSADDEPMARFSPGIYWLWNGSR